MTKPHIEQPLFTQYGDGRRTTCEKGMSQWGSKNLGEQGMPAIDILENYYGYDIYYDAAEKVEGVPLSYGGTVLTEGSSGEDVRVIQHQFNTISNHYPLIPKEREDGLYSSQTTDAVSLPVTGRGDFAVWYKISDVYVAVMKLSEPL